MWELRLQNKALFKRALGGTYMSLYKLLLKSFPESNCDGTPRLKELFNVCEQLQEVCVCVFVHYILVLTAMVNKAETTLFCNFRNGVNEGADDSTYRFLTI